MFKPQGRLQPISCSLALAIFVLASFCLAEVSGSHKKPAAPHTLTDWPEFHRLNMARYNPYESILSIDSVKSLWVKWSLPTGGIINGSPAVANGVVYVGSNDFNVYALNARTGVKLWTFPTGSYVQSTPAVANGVVYVASDDGNLYALDAATGKKRWSYSGQFQFESSPAVLDGVVYIGSYNGNVYALDANTGVPLWTYQTHNYVESSPAVANGVVYVSSYENGYLYALNARTGAEVWSFFTWGGASSPAVADGVVYVGGGWVYALDGRTGAELWNFQQGVGYSSPAVADGIVYIGGGIYDLYALDAHTGTELWTYHAGNDIDSSPAVANGVVYFGSNDARIYALDAKTGTWLWDYPTGGWITTSSPVVVNGMVYIGSSDYLFRAFTVSPVPPNEQVLYSFQDNADTQIPTSGVIFDRQGNLYGATEAGTVFQLAPPAKKGDSWTETVLYTFKGKNDNNDAMQPSGGLVIDGVGNLYGTTAYGGTGGCILLGILYGCGTVYEISPPQQKSGQWTETILYSFQSGNDGYYPWGSLTFDKAGNLYGATQFGGGKGNTCDAFYGGNCGTVFELCPPKQKGGQWTEQILHSFAGGTDGAEPNGGLVLDSKGAVFGATYIGGAANGNECGSTGCGTVFKLLPPTKNGGFWTEEILHKFLGPDAAEPFAGLVLGKHGNLYGTTLGGGPHGYGAIFELKNPQSESLAWTEQTLYSFSDGTDGAGPIGGVTFGAAGALYGTARYAHQWYGTVYRLTPNLEAGTWTFDVVHGFEGSPDGASPGASLVPDKDGNLYSTTMRGGTGQACQGGCGAVFEVSP